MFRPDHRSILVPTALTYPLRRCSSSLQGSVFFIIPSTSQNKHNLADLSTETSFESAQSLPQSILLLPFPSRLPPNVSLQISSSPTSIASSLSPRHRDHRNGSQRSAQSVQMREAQEQERRCRCFIARGREKQGFFRSRRPFSRLNGAQGGWETREKAFTNSEGFPRPGQRDREDPSPPVEEKTLDLVIKSILTVFRAAAELFSVALGPLTLPPRPHVACPFPCPPPPTPNNPSTTTASSDAGVLGLTSFGAV